MFLFFPLLPPLFPLFFFFNDPATTEIYTLSLHDALPIFSGAIVERMRFSAYVVFISLWALFVYSPIAHWVWGGGDRKSTRLNSSHGYISYAVFCLKKKKKKKQEHNQYNQRTYKFKLTP